MQATLCVVKIVCCERKPRKVVFVRQVETANLLVRRIPRVRRLIFEVVKSE